MSPVDPLAMIRPRRTIEGISAILLPYLDRSTIDWDGFTSHVRRTAEAGLTPAINMDTGYGNLLTDEEKRQALEITRQTLGGGRFVAGAFVVDTPGASLDREAYLRQISDIVERGGTPVICQSFGLTALTGDDLIQGYEAITADCDRFIAFELGSMFAPFGKIYTLEEYRGLLGLKRCLGAKHSSLRRELEWQRLQLRDAVRPDFRVYTGNDLAIDMVMYGSDYLLGLSTFAPDLFAQRDRAWATGDPSFYELNDLLQYLGFLAFRPPVPAYKHSAAMVMTLRGWITSDEPHPRCPRRPDSDRSILQDIVSRFTSV